MQPQLLLKDGTVVPLSDELYQMILSILNGNSTSSELGPSIDELEVEFADLFTEGGPSTDDLIEEHAQERQREERKLDSFV